MSFLRHEQIYRSDRVFGLLRKRSLQPRSRHHRFDEFAASYSLAGCSPAEPASALPAGSILNRPAELVNQNLRQVVYFSTGEMRIFQPVLTSSLFTTFWTRLPRVNPAPSGALFHS